MFPDIFCTFSDLVVKKRKEGSKNRNFKVDRVGIEKGKFPACIRVCICEHHYNCSTVEPRFVPVYPGVTQVVYGDVPVTAGCATVTCR